MADLLLSAKDIAQIKAKGIAEKKVFSQIELFKHGTYYLELNRSCTPGDGIKSISTDELDHILTIFEKHGPKRSITKFVPASGAASRMFKTLQEFRNGQNSLSKDVSEHPQFVYFIENIQKFAFYDDLQAAILKDNFDINDLLSKKNYKKIIDYLLDSKGLGYSCLPKTLLKFHRYPDHARTAFEEHLVEAVNYAKDENGICRLHFTVSADHKKSFNSLLEELLPEYEKAFGVQFDIDFSVQAASTDTIALDMENKPFRLDDGSLLFRPGGHGALIENLNNLKGDIIYIKNIDNVVPDRLNSFNSKWKKAIGGYLIKIQQKIFEYLEMLTKNFSDKTILRQALEFAKTELCLVPDGLTGEKAWRDFLIAGFNRPIRVCGVVKNVGEPGGGPFWVKNKNGSSSLQIVEGAQVDPASKTQQKIFYSSTHFNPVDIVCGVRDFKGRPFDLRQAVNSRAVFISQKSVQGRDLKALELPGLWNGAMSAWNTIFLEVPLVTFNPVKTVNDLLRKEHQPI